VTSQSTQGHVELHAPVCSRKEHRRGRHRRANCYLAGYRQPAVDLPSPPTYSKTNPNDQPIMYIALTSDSVTAGRLYDYGSTQVGQRISILRASAA